MSFPSKKYILLLYKRECHTKIVKFLEAEVNRATPNLASYEKIKKIALLDREFTIADGEITPTFKIKRNVVEKKYKDQIDALYVEGNLE